jgi:hypothetical protein
MKSHGMIGACENYPLDALAPGRLKNIVATLDIQRQHLFPRGLFEHTGEMHDAVDARQGFLERGHVADVRCAEFFATLGGAKRRNVE